MDPAALLTADAFDADKISEMIASSTLGDAEKAALTTAVTAAKDNPALVAGVIDQIKTALGL